LTSDQKEIWNLLAKIATVMNITSKATNKNKALIEAKLKEQIVEMFPKGKIIYSLKE
jgi:hypothetical protein